MADRGEAVKGRSIEDVAARLRAEAAEHHGDEAEVRAVLMARQNPGTGGGGIPNG